MLAISTSMIDLTILGVSGEVFHPNERVQLERIDERGQDRAARLIQGVERVAVIQEVPAVVQAVGLEKRRGEASVQQITGVVDVEPSVRVATIDFSKMEDREKADALGVHIVLCHAEPDGGVICV